MVYGQVLTKREQEIISKRINGGSLTRNESNILSKFIRPKLREIKRINSSLLLKRLEYNQKSKPIEKKIKEIILSEVKEIICIILYGSAIQTNYTEYNDIDVLIITKSKIWKNLSHKYDIIIKLIELGKKSGLKLDVQIIDENTLINEYVHSPSLVYQLKDSKIVMGRINLSKNVEISKLDLRMKLDWSDMDDENSRSEELYNSLRNVFLVKLLMNGTVDNQTLREEVNREMGEGIIKRLKNNTASRIDKKLVLSYIKRLLEKTDDEILSAKWEKIVLSKL